MEGPWKVFSAEGPAGAKCPRVQNRQEASVGGVGGVDGRRGCQIVCVVQRAVVGDRVCGTSQAIDIVLILNERGADGGITEKEHDLMSDCLIPWPVLLPGVIGEL